MGTLRHFAICCVALAACDATSSITATLGEPVVLRVGQSAELSSEGLQVGVTEVRQDCRCPTGVVCVWQGLAVVSVWVEKGQGERQDLLLATVDTAGQSSRAEYLGYAVELLQVSPGKTESIQQSDYRVTLLVSDK